MAKSKSEKKANQPNAVVKYFRETRGEIRKVTWPTRRESWRLTGIVLGVTVVTAAFLWFFDFIFSGAVQLLIERLIGI